MDQLKIGVRNGADERHGEQCASMRVLYTRTHIHVHARFETRIECIHASMACMPPFQLKSNFSKAEAKMEIVEGLVFKHHK